jgi:hypothetical protein
MGFVTTEFHGHSTQKKRVNQEGIEKNATEKKIEVI